MDKKEKNKYGLDVAAEKLNLPKYNVKEDLSVGVEPLYDDQMEDLQGRIKQPVQTMRGAELPEVKVTASAPKPSRLNIPKYNVKEDLPVGVEFISDGDMEDLQGRIKQPVQTMRGAELPEVKVTASAPRRRLEMPKYEHDLPKTIAQRDIQPVQKTTRDYMDELRELLKQDGESREREAKRKRDLAMIADLANLTVNAGSVAGGGNSVKQEMATKAASERLQAIRDKNAAQIRDFAVRRAEAKERARLEENRNVLQKDRNALEREKLNRQIEVDKQAKERQDKELDSKIKVDESVIRRNDAYAKYYANGGANNSTKPTKKAAYNGKEYNLGSNDDYLEMYYNMAENGVGIPVVDERGNAAGIKQYVNPTEAKNFIDSYLAKQKVAAGREENKPASRGRAY